MNDQTGQNTELRKEKRETRGENNEDLYKIRGQKTQFLTISLFIITDYCESQLCKLVIFYIGVAITVRSNKRRDGRGEVIA